MKKSEFEDFDPESDGFEPEEGFDPEGEFDPEEESDPEEGIAEEDDGFYSGPHEDMDFTEDDFIGYGDDGETPGEDDEEPGKKGLPLAAKIGLIFLAAVIVFAAWALGTSSGRSFSLGFVARFVARHAGTADDENEYIVTGDAVDPDEMYGSNISVDENGNVIIRDSEGNIIDSYKQPRSEDYVTTYLIFGIEQIGGAANTDAMMLVSINTRDNSIKLTSLMRDTYVDIPGWDKNKLNSAYAKGAYGAETGAEARSKGSALLIRTIEQTYDIKISGYACVNFSSFEKVIDRLGGIDIELGEAEAKYLNTTNYISNPDNRNVKAGWNHLNGNQAMGYVRVRKVETLGGTNNDYGRTLRQRRVINAIISKYKSTKLTDLFSLTSDLIGYVNTSLTEQQMQEGLTMIVNNGIYTTNSMRLPTGELFRDSGPDGIYNGSKYVTYTLVIDDYLEDNIKALHQFVFLDEEEPEDTEETDGAE